MTPPMLSSVMSIHPHISVGFSCLHAPVCSAQANVWVNANLNSNLNLNANNNAMTAGG